MIAPPVAGTCSAPRTSNRKPNSRKTTSASRIDEPVGPVPRVRGGAEQVAADDVAPARGVHGRNLTGGLRAARAVGVRRPRWRHRRADDGGQVAGLARGRGAAGRRRCPGAAASARPAVDPLLVAGVGERGPDVVEQGGRRRRPPAPGRPVSGCTRSPVRPDRAARQAATRSTSVRTSGGGRPARASRAAVSTRPRTSPARMTASSTLQRDVGRPHLDGGPVRRQAGVEVDHPRVEDRAGGQQVVDEPVVGGGVAEDRRWARRRASGCQAWERKLA